MAHYQQMEAIVWVQLVNNWQLLIQHPRSLPQLPSHQFLQLLSD